MSVSKTVLLVEDDKDVRDFMEAVLRRGGYHVLMASSGEEAMGIAKSRPVDVMVTDLVLDSMGGLELAWRVIEEGAKFGIVLVSGYADPRAALDSLPSGSLSFLAKPFDADDLLEAVRARLPESDPS